MPDDVNIPWWLRLVPTLIPRNTPTITDQVKCPPGYHRDLATGGCVPDTTPPGTLVEVDTGAAPPNTGTPRPPKPPPDEARGPLPVPPGTVLPPASSPSVDTATGRYFPRARAPRLPSLIEAANTAGLVLWVLGSVVFTSTEELMRQAGNRPAPTGPPRRRRPPHAGDENVIEPPFPWSFPRPGTPAPGPFPLPRRIPSARPQPGSIVDPTTGAPLPAPRARTVPRTRAPVSRVPSPLEPISILELPQPIDEYARTPDDDPFTTYRTSPGPRPRVRPGPRVIGDPGEVIGPGVGGGPLVFSPYPFLVPRNRPRNRPRALPRTLTPQQPTSSPTPRAAPRAPPAPFNPLTPLQTPVPTSQPQGLRKPTQANPCTEQREARRSRQKKCKQYTYKRIRVCGDKILNRKRGARGRYA